MSENIAPVQIDPKSTTQNIVKGIQDKAAGKPPVPSTEPQKGGQPAAIPDPNAGKEKYVVDSKEIWLTPEQARAYVQKGIAFEPKVTQLAQLQHETQLFLERLKTDPASILFDKRIGLTPEMAFEKIMGSDNISEVTKEKVGKWYWENVVEPGKLSPQELKAREDARYRQEREKSDSLGKENAIKAENQRRVDIAIQQIKGNIAEAMQESGLPNTDSPLGTFMARRVADKMRLAYFQKQSMTPKQAIDQVKNELKSIQTSWYDHLDEENLVKELGEKNAEKVKKYFLKLVKESDKKPLIDNRVPSTRKGERKTMNLDEFHDRLEEFKKKG